MKLNAGILSLISIVGIGCTKNNYLAEPDVTVHRSFEVQVDTIRIPLDSVSLASYNEMNCISSGENHYALGLNKTRSAIDIFDITNEKLLKHISLEDSKGILDDVRGFYAIDFNNLMVITPGKLVFFDTSGIVNDYINLYQLISEDYSRFGEPAINIHFPLNFYTIDNRPSVLFYSYRDSKEYLNSNAVLLFDTATKRLDPIPIQYSDYFKENQGRVGFLAYLNLGHVTKDYIVYNFVYESNIYRFNRLTEEIEIFAGEIPGIDPLAKVFHGESHDELSIHAIENPHYFKLLYDQEKKYYYRPVWKQIKYQQDENYFNSFLDKELLISIFDEDLNLIGKYDLPKDTYPPHLWFMSDKGLVLSPTHPRSVYLKNEDVLEFHVFKFK